jgi:DNA repair exonuclease SbcCD ATPase subunit
MVEHGLLEISDFCCIQHAKINLAKAGLTLIVGDNQDTNAAINNGSGKTTIPKALTWCLYEDTLDGDRHDEVIRWEQSRAQVSHTIKIGRDVWRVTRARTKGRPHLELKVARDFRKGSEFEPIQGDRKELQAKIEELIGKDFRSFCNTTLYGEGDIARFYSATDSVKKDSLHRLLKSDVFKRAQGYIKKTYFDGLSKKVSEQERELETLKARLEEYDIKEIKTRYEQWSVERDERVARCTEACQCYIGEISKIKREAQQEKKRLENNAVSLDAQIKDVVVFMRPLECSSQRLLELEKERDKFISDKATLSAQISSKKESLSFLDGDECPTCSSSLLEGKGGEYKTNLSKQLSDLVSKRDKVIVCLNKKRRDVETKAKEVKELDRYSRELAELTFQQKALKSTIETADFRLKDAIEERKALAKESLADAKRIEKETNPHKDSYDKAKERVDALKRKLAEKKTELEKTRSDFAHYGFWVKAFGPGGLPSLLLDSKMGFLSERANHYLLTLADGDITVFYRTQRELKTKSQMRDEIVCDLIIEGVPDVKASKAQKRKIDIASDLGLVDMASSRSGRSNLLMMDEVLDGMDAEGVRRVLDLIHELRTLYPSIVVITHEAGLLEVFDRAICARKKNGATNVVGMKG